MFTMTTEAAVYLVAGAAGNLGRRTMEVLARRGARLAGADRGEAPADLGAALWVAGADFFEPAACEAMVAAVIDHYGRLDGVAHVVGGFTTVAAAEGGPDVWQEMFRLNTLTTLNVFRAALPAMRAAGRGSLVAVGAGAALNAPATFGPYAASKAAVLRLVEAFAAELKGEGVRVNAVLPGTMDTPQNRTAMPNVDPVRWVRPEEVAEVMAFLLDAAASGVTGAAVPVPGRT
jgi:NAD(P)-dependent dehydrogenase (short-subunit alcohol dehydrogenase family)